MAIIWMESCFYKEMIVFETLYYTCSLKLEGDFECSKVALLFCKILRLKFLPCIQQMPLKWSFFKCAQGKLSVGFFLSRKGIKCIEMAWKKVFSNLKENRVEHVKE